jgi:N-acetylglucosaminyl-diphospho-decaprenol L-rhamnosyltransferase
MVDLSVIVVSYNTRDLLAACLDSVQSARYPGSREVLVVDNASSDGSAEMVAAQYPTCALVRNSENRGFAAANNQALALAAGRLILLLNSDTALTPESLVEMQSAFGAYPDLGIVGPALLNDDHSRQPSWGDFPSVWQEFLFQTYLFKLWPVRFPYGRRVRPHLLVDYQHFHRVDWVTGAALMMKREVYERAGGLPQENFMYGEELEFCARAQRAGFGVAYVPAAEVYHRQGGSVRGDYGRWIESYTQATLNYFDRYSSRRKGRQVAVLVLAGSRLREWIWTVAAMAWPARRQEALARAGGYRRAAELAWHSYIEYLAAPANP